MSSARETALEALYQKLLTLTTDGLSAVPDIRRNEESPVSTKAAGFVNLQDGDPGEPEISLSPIRYRYEHIAVLTITVRGVASADRDSQMDNILQAIGELLSDDKTLGGAVDWIEPQAPEADVIQLDGAPGEKTCNVPILLIYETDSPI